MRAQLLSILDDKSYTVDERLRAADLLVRTPDPSAAVQEEKPPLAGPLSSLIAPTVVAAVVGALSGIITVMLNNSSVATLERAKFEYDIIRNTIDLHQNDDEQKAAALLFLSRVGIVSQLNAEFLSNNQSVKGAPILGSASVVSGQSPILKLPQDPDQIAELMSISAQAGTLGWMRHAIEELGTRELPGDEANPLILRYAAGITDDYQDDDIPWSGLFVAWVLRSAGYEIPSAPLASRSWTNWGEAVEIPRPGALLVFWRQSRDGYQGHVGFMVGEDVEHYHVLGGNQENTVSIATVSKDRLLAARMPPNM